MVPRSAAPIRVADLGAGEDVPNQREAVGVQAARRDRDDRVAVAHPVGPEQAVGLDDADRRARDVVVVGAHEAGVLGRLAADEGGAGVGAGPGDAGDDRGDALGHDPAAGDVVGHEQRLGADHDDVVDDHAHEVLADGVVLVERLGDRDLRADAVGRRREQRPRIVLRERQVEEAGEAADAAEHARAVGRGDRLLHEFDGEVAGPGVDSGSGVGRVRVGHPSSVPAARAANRALPPRPD